MIRLAQDGGLWRVTIDRPDKANSLTPGMLAEIAEIAEARHMVAGDDNDAFLGAILDFVDRHAAGRVG